MANNYSSTNIPGPLDGPTPLDRIMAEPVNEDGSIEGLEDLEMGDEYMDDHEILEWANETIPDAADYWEAQFAQSREDLQFLAKEHWPSAVLSARGTSKPAPVYDLTTPYVDRVTSDVRENPPGAIIRRSDSAKDQYLAEYLQGYIRHVEASVNHKAKLEAASRNQVGGGVSWLIPGYDLADDFSFEHTLTLESPEDPTSVLLDIDSTEVDGADALWGCQLKETTFQTAEHKYGLDRQEASTSFGVPKLQKFWLKDKGVVLARVWRKVLVKDTLVQIQELTTGDISSQWSSYISERPELFANHRVLKERDGERTVVYHYLIGGNRVLHKQIWPGNVMPVIPVYGALNWHTKGKIYEGLVRRIMDPQRAYNYYKAAETETVALTPRAPYVLPVGSIDDFEQDWDTVNSAAKPYLYYHPFDKEGRPIEKPSRDSLGVDIQGISAAAAEIQRVIGSIIGSFDNPVGASGVEQSGKAILAKAKASDRQNSLFYSNLSHSYSRVTQAWVSMRLALISEDTDLSYEDVDGKKGSVRIGTSEQRDPSTGKIAVYDANKGKYDAVISVGPSYASKRDEAAQASIESLALLPDAQRAAISPQVIGMQDWPDSERSKKILIASLPPELQEAYKEEDADEMPIPEAAKQMLDQLTGELQAGQQESTLLMQQLAEQAKIIEQLNAQLNSNIQAAEIKAASDERQNLITNQTKLELKQMELTGDQESLIIEKAAERALVMMQEQHETIRKRMEAASAVQAEAVRALSSPQTAQQPMTPLDGVV
jgi:hypothetical protein